MTCERFLDSVIAARWPLMVAGLAIAAVAYGPARQVQFDRSIENMFAADDPLLAPYEALQREFGGNEIVMAVYRDPQLLAADGSGLARLKEVSTQMKHVEGVRDVLSLAEVSALLEQLEKGKGFLRFFRRRDDWQGPAILNPASPLAERYRELFAGYTHAADGQTAAVVCMLEPTQASGRRQPPDTATTKSVAPADSNSAAARLARPSYREADASRSPIDSRQVTIAALRDIVTNLPGGLAPGVLAGEPVMVVEGFSLLEEDGRRLGRWSTLLLGLTILVCFRSLRWLIVPIAVVQWSLLVTQATLVWSGMRLSMVSSMLTAIVTVVGVATVVHLIVRFREFRAAGQSPRSALHAAGVLLAGPIAGAILTDAVGFGSLWWAQVGPVQDYGTMKVVGSLLVIPAVCLLVPALALVGARDTPATAAKPEANRLAAALGRSIVTIRSRPGTIAAAALAVALLAAAGVFRLEVETDFTRNFRRGSRIVAAYEFVETNLGGAGVWDITLPAPPVLDKEYVARVRQLQERLRVLPALTKVISLVDAIDAAEADSALALAPPELRLQGMAAAMPTFTAALLSSDLDEHGEGRLRIMLRARERQSAEDKRRLIEQVTELARAEFPPTERSRGAEVTGFFVLLTNLIESMLRDQWTTFGIATAGIFVMMLAFFRSLKLALIALVPNALPILVVMGLMGWITLLGLADLKINMGAAMIAAVSMGLSVDSSIHYLAAYRRQRRAGQAVAASLTAVQQTVGQAMIFSTLALIVGFSVLCTSEFVPTVYFGALVSLAMLGGLVGNLVVLPLLVSLADA